MTGSYNPMLAAAWIVVIALSLYALSVLASYVRRWQLKSSAQSSNALAERGERDGVTGVANRSMFLERMDARMADAKRDGQVFGLMFLDLDGFKTVNDSLGYGAGDELLKAFSDDLLRRVRSETRVARLGGDEFVLMLDHGEGLKETREIAPIARSIFERMQKNFQIDGMPLRVTASAGVAIYPQDGETATALLRSANIAMHDAKRQGKNSCRFFHPSMSDAASRALQINRSLAEALENNQFSLVFQPKFDGRENRVTGAEALIRWQHPVVGNIPPMEFIPMAEETGQILQISEWVIAEVCRQIKTWQQMGLPVLRVAINLSPEQLRQERYVERVKAMVAEAAIPQGSIMFEITETAAMREPALAAEVIREFQGAGFDFAIDDFGTGYSSMAYLQEFRVKELKIDRCFINSLEAGAEEGHTIVSAIIALAHALNMRVVAEGVETAAQLKKLNGMMCDEVQGYLLGRPMVPADFEKLLRGDEAKDELATAQKALGKEPEPLRALHSALA